jgi:hypothetical protein
MTEVAPADATPPDELVITLSKPVILGPLSCTELRLREPTGAEMIAVQAKEDWDHDCALIALVAGVPEPLVVKIGVADLYKARRFLNHFFV